MSVRNRRSSSRSVSFLVVCLAVVYVVLRLVNIDTSISVDEPVFLGISANFYTALARGDFARTAQFLYPAVPIMWSGTIGFLLGLPGYVRDYGQFIPPDFQGNVTPIRSVGGDPLEVLHLARAIKVLLQGACFAVAVTMMFRLFGTWVGLVASALIIFDPFLISHDQLLHVDGVTGISAFACMLLITYADRHPEHLRYWAFAGMLGAICWLTRLTGLALIPITAVVLLDGAIGRYRRSECSLQSACAWFVRRFGLFLGISVVATFVLWPALWVAPLGTLDGLVTSWQAAMGTPHEWGVHFMGKSVSGDPGLLFYVMVALFKLTPFTMVGLAIFAVAAMFRIETMLPDRNWRPIVILGSFMVAYSIGMAFGARKFDRYILPDFPFLDLFAAIALVGIVGLLWQQRNAAVRYAGVAFVALLLIGQFASSTSARPYALLYYNPLMGGLREAEYVLMPGWGEGLDEASAWILSRPGGPPYMVRASISPPMLSYSLPDAVLVGSLGMESTPENVWNWANTDYGITTILQWNRDAYANIAEAFVGREPVHTVKVDGRDIVRVYDLSQIPPPAAMLSESGCSWTFDAGITYAATGPHILRGNEVAFAAGMQRIELIFQTADVTKLRPLYAINGTLHARDGNAADIVFSASLTPALEPGLLSRAVTDISLPAGRMLDQYWAEVRLADAATGQPLQATPLGGTSIADVAGKLAC